MRRLLALLLPAILSAADEWPQFRGNPQLTGVTASVVPATLKLLWTYEAGDAIESSAAISGGSVYVGAQTAELLAIDLATGKLRWKYKAQDGIGESSPAVANGVVYAAGGTEFDGGKLYAFAAGGCGQPTCPPLWTGELGAGTAGGGRGSGRGVAG